MMTASCSLCNFFVLHELYIKMDNMTAPHFCTVGGSGDALSIFIYSLWCTFEGCHSVLSFAVPPQQMSKNHKVPLTSTPGEWQMWPFSSVNPYAHWSWAENVSIIRETADSINYQVPLTASALLEHMRRTEREYLVSYISKNMWMPLLISGLGCVSHTHRWQVHTIKYKNMHTPFDRPFAVGDFHWMASNNSICQISALVILLRSTINGVIVKWKCLGINNRLPWELKATQAHSLGKQHYSSTIQELFLESSGIILSAPCFTIWQSDGGHYLPECTITTVMLCEGLGLFCVV